MNLGLKGKRALVLGASKGLGHAIAAGLAAEGCDLVIASRDVATLEAQAKRFSDTHGVRAFAASADIADGPGLDVLANFAEDRLGGVDILLLNHGGPPPKTAPNVTAEDLAAWFPRLVGNPIRLASRLIPGMRQRKWGRVLTVGSSAMIQPIPQLAISTILRGSMVGWSKSMATELAGEGLTFNILAPGAIRTDRILETVAAEARSSGQSQDEVAKRREAAIPAGRFGSPEEFAAVAVFLASEQAAYITGSIVRIDGGAIRCV